MKKAILAMAFCLASITIALAQSPDEALVRKTVSYYLDGGTNNDYETLKKAFHPAATMRYIKNGEYLSVNAVEFFGKVMKPGPKQKRETAIKSVSVAGHAATATLEIDYGSALITDYMSLLKIDGEWKIVNKIFYREKK